MQDKNRIGLAGCGSLLLSAIPLNDLKSNWRSSAVVFIYTIDLSEGGKL